MTLAVQLDAEGTERPPDHFWWEWRARGALSSAVTFHMAAGEVVRAREALQDALSRVSPEVATK